VSDPSEPDVALRRHRPSAQARRDALLRAAVEVAAERGAAGVTHRAVTERAGLPLATVSYFFPSIDDLVAEALHTFVTDEVTKLSELAAALAAGESTPDDLAAVLPAALAEAAMPSGELPWTLAQFETYLHAARGDALRPAAAEALATYDRMAAQALIAAGAPDAGDAAPAFIALADGFALRHLAHPQAGDVAALQRALRLLFLGLLVDAGHVDRATRLAQGD
jgi:DNA-binding transcriptional regulator YbjK